jgi:choice-of-anchor A domain-containing protein
MVNVLNDTNNSSLVVVNVLGTIEGGRFNLTNALINLHGLSADNLVWNVCDASLVGLTNVQFRGSLLAPFSDVTLGNVQVNGSLVAASLVGSSFEQNQAPFAGFFCPA